MQPAHYCRPRGGRARGQRSAAAPATRRTFASAFALASALALPLSLSLSLAPTACSLSPLASPAADPNRYRLAKSGDHWDRAGEDPVFADLEARYPEFFAVILDPTTTHVPNLLGVRDDLEKSPVDRRNYDALNAVAIAYFETNYRAESQRGEGMHYLSLSQRSAHLLAVPWRAYSEIHEPALRSAIVDFFEDAGSGEKLGSGPTASRLVRIVSTLQRKEPDEGRRARIRALAARLERRWISDAESPALQP